MDDEIPLSHTYDWETRFLVSESPVSESLELLEIQRENYGGILLDHFMSLTHGLKFLQSLLLFSDNENLKRRAAYSVSNVKQKLHSLTGLREDESLVTTLENEYADLREQMKNIIIKPGTNEYDVLFPNIFSRQYILRETSLFLLEKIEELLCFDCKADQINQMMKELKDIRNMLKFLLEPLFRCEEDYYRAMAEIEEKILTTVVAVLERAACFIYVSFLGKMDNEMVHSLRYSLSGLIIEDSQIMMYLIFDVHSIEDNDISKSLLLLEIHRQYYEGILMDHSMCLTHGLEFLKTLSRFSTNENLKWRVEYPVFYVKRKLHSLTGLKKDDSLVIKLEHEYADLRELMKNIIIKPGTNEYDVLFPNIFSQRYILKETSLFLCEKIEELLTLYCKPDQISPMMKEVEDIRIMLKYLLEPFFRCEEDHYRPVYGIEEEEIFTTVAAVLERAACFIYVSFVGKMDNEMVHCLKYSVSSLIIEDSQFMKMYIIFVEHFIEENDISKSLRLLELYGKAYGGILMDHSMSLIYGLGFLRTLLQISTNESLIRRVEYSVSTVKRKLYSLTGFRKDERLVMKLEHEYANLREQMKTIIIKPGTDEYDVLFPDFFSQLYSLKDTSLFLCEKIEELVSLDCKADQISPMMKELEDIRIMLKYLLETCFRCEEDRYWPMDGEIFATVTAVVERAACFIYVSFVGEMDNEMVHSVKYSLSGLIIKEARIMNMYHIRDVYSIEDHDISESHRLLEIHREYYGGILMDHYMSVTHGLEFLKTLLPFSTNENLKWRAHYSVFYVKQKLQSLTDFRKDERLAMKLEHEYADLREQMKTIIINPGTDEYDVLFPDIFSRRYILNETSLFLSEKIDKLVSSDCKADQISPMKQDLEDIKNMVKYLLGPFVSYEEDGYRSMDEIEREKIIPIVTALLERTACFIYVSFVGKMDNEMVHSVKYILSGLIIKEARIMEMNLNLAVDSIYGLESDIFGLLKLLKRNKEHYMGTNMGATLDYHIMSIENGLQLLVRILKLSRYIGLKLCIKELVSNVKRRLDGLPPNQEDKFLVVNLEYAYGELRKEMQNVFIRPTTNDYVTLFPEYIKERQRFSRTKDFLLDEIRKLVTSGWKADKIAPIMNELQELRNKLTSLNLLIGYVPVSNPLAMNNEEKDIFAVVTTFLDRASCLVYLSFIGELNEDMLVSLRKNFSSLIEEIERKVVSFILGRGFEDVGKFDIDISLSLLKRQEEYFVGTINEAMLKDHVMSLKHGIEFLEWLLKIYNGRLSRYLECHIILLAGYVKQRLEWLQYIHKDESLNMYVNDAYADLREEMKNIFMNQAAVEYAIIFPDLDVTTHIRGDNDFLIEKIKTLVTSNCKADQIAPLNEELQQLRKMLISLTPLDHYNGGIYNRVSTIHQKATILIYLSFVGKMDIEMALSVKSNISTAIKEIDVLKMYTMILNEILVQGHIHYLNKDLCLLQNLILLFKGNLERFNNASSELYGALIDIHTFLGGLSPNVVLRKLHLLHLKFQAILGHSIPVICSCYLENMEADISDEVKCVFDLIKDIKSEAQEIKLYYFPRVDDLGFLEFFLGNLKDLKELMENQEHQETSVKEEIVAIQSLLSLPKNEYDLGFLEFFSGYLKDLMLKTSIKEAIDAVHFEVQSLLSLVRIRDEELKETPWTDMINMAYQAEYIIDLYRVNSSTNLELISSLHKIIEQLRRIRADGADGRALKDVAMTSKPHVGTAVVSDNDAIVGSEEETRIIKEDLLEGEKDLNELVSDNDAIVGLDEETKTIMEDLLKGEKDLNVISIVGMAGVGKTTLAFTLFNSTPSIVCQFDIRAWCTVSQSYQNRDVLLSILDQVNASDQIHKRMSDEQKLADHLCRSLKKRRYLIVLDDIWDTKMWKELKRYLPDDKTCSRVLITSRNIDVVDQIGSKVNELRGLSDEKSWELFQRKMLAIGRLSDDLQNISKGIVWSCKGLPLSIVIIVGILSNIERTRKKWNEIAESASSLVLSDPQGRCKDILELSYNHLPNHLRSCFLYLGSFPEDQEISVTRLITMWIGEGLVRDTNSESAEEVAKKYMNDLIAKSLVIPAKERSRGGIKAFRLHDLLRDFCLDKAKEKHFFTLLDSRNRSRLLQDPRRLIINGPLINDLRFSCHSIRSMIWFDRLDASYIVDKIGSCDMVLLHVLEVDEVQSGSFPDISSLVHLRYLALGWLNWRHSGFPSSISKLQNLQVLILRCRCLVEVPDLIWDKVKLRHIHISPAASFQVNSDRLQTSSSLLENLRSLSNAHVSGGNSEWLSKLSGLQRLSCVFMDVNDSDPEEDEYLEEDDDLEEDEDDDDRDREEDNDLEANRFQMLRFNSHLTSLKLRNATDRMQIFIGTCQLPSSLRELTLSKFSFTSNDISKIGRTVPQLEVFKINSCCVSSGCEWNVDDEDFPELKVLKLRDLEVSNWIASEDSFPKLEQLWVEKCDYLDEIPLDFGYLPNLLLISVRDCPPSIDESAKKIEKLQHDQQNNGMKVHIYPRKRKPCWK